MLDSSLIEDDDDDDDDDDEGEGEGEHEKEGRKSTVDDGGAAAIQ